MDTFVPPRPPDGGTQDKPEWKVLKAEFGDGYTQMAPDGINPIRRVLSLTWSYLTPSQSNPMVAFLQAHIGQTFLYSPTDEAPEKWTCEDYTDKRENGGLRTLSITFRQSFNLSG